MDDIIQSIHTLLNQWIDMDYIKPSDIPNIDLYMDQVTTFMDEHLENTKRNNEDKILTKTMINNYTKHDLLPPPVKKKYSRDHMLFLIFIYYFKNNLSISDIQRVLEPIADNFYYKDKKKVKLENLYSEIMKLQKDLFVDMEKDINRKIDLAQQAFTNKKYKDEKLVFLFTFIALLSMESYMKKHMIEKLIDEYFQDKEDD
jgi:DNA-binding transcriptional MerR regulator